MAVPDTSERGGEGLVVMVIGAVLCGLIYRAALPDLPDGFGDDDTVNWARHARQIEFFRLAGLMCWVGVVFSARHQVPQDRLGLFRGCGLLAAGLLLVGGVARLTAAVGFSGNFEDVVGLFERLASVADTIALVPGGIALVGFGRAIVGTTVLGGDSLGLRATLMTIGTAVAVTGLTPLLYIEADRDVSPFTPGGIVPTFGFLGLLVGVGLIGAQFLAAIQTRDSVPISAPLPRPPEEGTAGAGAGGQ